MECPRRDRADRIDSVYLRALGASLFGYAVLGKGFAYLGIPPLFPGELLLALGVVVAYRAGSFPAVFASPSNIVLAALMAWTATRLLPFLGAYGADAVRDGAIVYYGGFALIVNGLVLAGPERVERFVEAYARFAGLFPILGITAYMLTRFDVPLPALNSSGVPIVQVKPGDCAVHAAGVMAFGAVGLARIGWFRWCVLLVLVVMAACANRGGMLAIAAACAIAAVATLQVRQALYATLAAFILLGAALALEVATTETIKPEGSVERRVSAVQLVNNISGVFGTASDSGDDTKEWRKDWWKQIADETLRGPLFWTGHGFGVNLAELGGIINGDAEDTAPLRSPHSIHMTILARGGVPLLSLWLSFLAAWFAGVGAAAMRARRAGHERWYALFVWLSCYVLAVLINSSFDVALEGPMIGVWFWCLIGFGAGATAVHRAAASRTRGAPACA